MYIIPCTPHLSIIYNLNFVQLTSLTSVLLLPKKKKYLKIIQVISQRESKVNHLNFNQKSEKISESEVKMDFFNVLLPVHIKYDFVSESNQRELQKV